MEFRAYLRLFAISLIGAWFERAWNNGWLQIGQGNTLTHIPRQVAAVFDEVSHAMMPGGKTPKEDMPIIYGISFDSFWLRTQQLALAGDLAAQHWIELNEHLKLSHWEWMILALLVVTEFDLHVLRALRFVMAEEEASQPRWGFLTHMLAKPKKLAQCEDALNPNRSLLFRESLVTLEMDALTPISSARVRLNPDVGQYLLGQSQASERFESALALSEVSKSIQIQLRTASHISKPCRLAIHGPVGSGRRHVARVLSGFLQTTGIWCLDLSLALDQDQAIAMIHEARRMACLRNALIVITQFPSFEELSNVPLRALALDLHQSHQPVSWLISGDVPRGVCIEPEAHIRIGMPNRATRESYWRELLGAQLDTISYQQLAGQFLLSRGQIEETVRSVVLPDENSARYSALASAARAISSQGLGRLAVPEPARVEFNQLIVSSECRTALEDLLMYARHRKDLAKDWGFERSMPYGLGLAALFSGPPGTGKTYGAQVIATELQLELYRVDLAQLVSKYIGETEKHLGELFDAAENGEVLLLFDEADSIFGKRTEVKSSVDRYANLEINYLLQRLERFSGVSILTSNFDSAIDEAFMRRIRFKVPFELPNFESRYVLWNKFLSKSIPRDHDVEVEFLAETFELSGGHIKEAVLRAASIAYGSDSKCVTQDLLIRSALLEYKKLGKLAPQIDFDDPEDRSRWN